MTQQTSHVIIGLLSIMVVILAAGLYMHMQSPTDTQKNTNSYVNNIPALPTQTYEEDNASQDRFDDITKDIQREIQTNSGTIRLSRPETFTITIDDAQKGGRVLFTDVQTGFGNGTLLHHSTTSNPNIHVLQSSDGDICASWTDTYYIDTYDWTGVKVLDRYICGHESITIQNKNGDVFDLSFEKVGTCEHTVGQEMICSDTGIVTYASIMINGKRAISLTNTIGSCAGDAGIDGLCAITNEPSFEFVGISQNLDTAYIQLSAATTTLYALTVADGSMEEIDELPQALLAIEN